MQFKIFAFLMLLVCAVLGFVTAVDRDVCDKTINNHFENRCKKCCTLAGFDMDKSHHISATEKEPRNCACLHKNEE